MRLVPVFLEANNQTNNECLPKFVQTDNASSSINTANTYQFLYVLIKGEVFSRAKTLREQKLQRYKRIARNLKKMFLLR